MSSSEFSDWMTFSEDEPFGAPWENWLMAIPAYQFACANTPKNKPRPEFKKLLWESPRTRQQRGLKSFRQTMRAKAKQVKNGQS